MGISTRAGATGTECSLSVCRQEARGRGERRPGRAKPAGGRRAAGESTEAVTGLLPQAELADDRQVPLPLGLAEVLQQVRPQADELEQPAAAGEVLLVRPHVLGQLV